MRTPPRFVATEKIQAVFDDIDWHAPGVRYQVQKLLEDKLSEVAQEAERARESPVEPAFDRMGLSRWPKGSLEYDVATLACLLSDSLIGPSFARHQIVAWIKGIAQKHKLYSPCNATRVDRDDLRLVLGYARGWRANPADVEGARLRIQAALDAQTSQE